MRNKQNHNDIVMRVSLAKRSYSKNGHDASNVIAMENNNASGMSHEIDINKYLLNFIINIVIIFGFWCWRSSL